MEQAIFLCPNPLLPKPEKSITLNHMKTLPLKKEYNVLSFFERLFIIPNMTYNASAVKIEAFSICIL